MLALECGRKVSHRYSDRQLKWDAQSVQLVVGASVYPKPVRQGQIVRVRASKADVEGSEPGRLVQDALEFNKPSNDNPPQQSARAPIQQEERQPGDLLGGKYQVVEMLAKGKSGLVYKASVRRCTALHSCLLHVALPGLHPRNQPCLFVHPADPLCLLCQGARLWLRLHSAHCQLCSINCEHSGIFALQAERPGGGFVAVKTLSLRSMADWKQLELFEKEAKAMRKLSHKGIPAYIDYFEVDSDGDRGYFLVQVICF